MISNCLSIVILLNQTIFERKLKTEHTYNKTIELTRIFKNVTKVHVNNLNLMKIMGRFSETGTIYNKANRLALSLP